MPTENTRLHILYMRNIIVSQISTLAIPKNMTKKVQYHKNKLKFISKTSELKRGRTLTQEEDVRCF